MNQNLINNNFLSRNSAKNSYYTPNISENNINLNTKFDNSKIINNTRNKKVINNNNRINNYNKNNNMDVNNNNNRNMKINQIKINNNIKDVRISNTSINNNNRNNMNNNNNININRNEGKTMKNKVKENIKDDGLKETIEIDNSLINDSELNIPLIIDTLIYNKIMKSNNEKEKEKEKQEQKLDNIIHNNVYSNNIKENKKQKIKESIQVEYDDEDNHLILPIKLEDTVKLKKINDNEENTEKFEIKNDIKNGSSNKGNIINDLKNINTNNNNNNNDYINENINNINKTENENKKENVVPKDIKKEENNKDDQIQAEIQKSTNELNNSKVEDNTTIGEELLVKQIVSNSEKQEKAKSSRHISFKLENNVIISYKIDELITDLVVNKEGQEDAIPFKRDFNLYEKILKRKVPPNPIIKKFDKNEIKTRTDYVLMENLDEQEIIPELYDENEEDIKSLEKS
jgi:hypothetical protein